MMKCLTMTGPLFGLLTLSLLAPGCSTNPATGERIPMLINRDQEIAIGEEAAPEFEQAFQGLVRDEQVQQYVRLVGSRVAEASERPMPYEFAALRSEVPNAFALPGGKVYVTVGLMEVMESERELAAVLAHEVGHVAAQHNVQALQRQVGASILVDVAVRVAGGESGQVAGQVTQIVTGLGNLRYSRQDEYQADELGVRYMARAGYNPWGMVELLTRLNQLGGSGGSLGEFFSTHPLTEKRIEEAEQIVRDNHPQARRDEAPQNMQRFLAMRQLAVEEKMAQDTGEPVNETDED
ncbi:MAG: M48 family metalloprotease [Phycisphaerae bacterium]